MSFDRYRRESLELSTLDLRAVSERRVIRTGAGGAEIPFPHFKFAALAAGQAVAVAHVAAHYLGAAAYALRAAAASVAVGDAEGARLQELGWQRKRIPATLRELVLEDQRARNDICWGVFTG